MALTTARKVAIEHYRAEIDRLLEANHQMDAKVFTTHRYVDGIFTPTTPETIEFNRKQILLFEEAISIASGSDVE